MSLTLFNGLLIAAATGCGLLAGIFFTFSNFVMPALERLPQDQGIAAMQSINKTVLNPLFFLLFFGTAGLCVAGIGMVIFQPGPQRLVLPILGGILYLSGAFAVTLRRNVPLNQKLAQVDPQTSSHQAWRQDFLPPWLVWNHIRTLACLLAAVSLTVSALA